MARTIHESIAGIDLLVPTNYDGFSIGSGVNGMPNGDDCLIVTPAAAPSGKCRAFAPAPVLSPDFMHISSTAAFSMSYWAKAAVVNPSAGGALNIGWENAAATARGNAASPFSCAIQTTTNGSLNVSQFCNLYNGSSGSTSIAWTSSPASASWTLFVWMFGAPSAPCYYYIARVDQVAPLTLTSPTNRTASSVSNFTATQNFFIGAYSDLTINNLARPISIGKIAFHDRLLTITEVQMMHHAMGGL